MSILRFETPQLDELLSMNDIYWTGALYAAGVQEMDADDDHPEPVADAVSFVMPYRAATERYTVHVRGCTACQDSPVWDIGCEFGARLAHIAADAMSAQADMSNQN